MTRNNASSPAIIFTIIMAVGLITVNSFINGQFNLKIIISGIIGAAVGGLAFAIIIGYFLKRTDKIQISLAENEHIIKEDFANRKIKLESVGGKLFLTNKRLIFKSHKINIQKHTFELATEEIKSWRKYKTMGIISNGLEIITDQVITEKFVVNNPDMWITELEKLKENQS